VITPEPLVWLIDPIAFPAVEPDIGFRFVVFVFREPMSGPENGAGNDYQQSHEGESLAKCIFAGEWVQISHLGTFDCRHRHFAAVETW
jgi:hypothetical protein